MHEARTLIDLSHAIHDGMTTYKGLPPPVLSDYLSRRDSHRHYAEGVEFHIGKIEMVANTGTYLDSPYHRYADGADLSGLPLPAVADLDGVAVRVPQTNGRAIDPDVFDGIALGGKAVLVHTGWDAHWGTERYFGAHPYLTRETAEYLRDQRVRLVGIDSLNIDNADDPFRPVHSILLEAGILIVEHMTNLGALPDRDFRFFAVPPAVRGLGSFPVRAFAVVGSVPR